VVLLLYHLLINQIVHIAMSLFTAQNNQQMKSYIFTTNGLFLKHNYCILEKYFLLLLAIHREAV
jgi:hypothetical protein